VGKVISENVEFVSLSPDEAKQRMEQKGMPPWAIQTFLAISEGQRAGKAAYITTNVADIGPI